MPSQNRLIVSHLLLRQLLGWMGVSLPFWLVVLNWIFGGRGIESSISAYYHLTYVGAVFVGFLFAIGFRLQIPGLSQRGLSLGYQLLANVLGG